MPSGIPRLVIALKSCYSLANQVKGLIERQGNVNCSALGSMKDQKEYCRYLTYESLEIEIISGRTNQNKNDERYPGS